MNSVIAHHCGRLTQYLVEASLLGIHKHSMNICKMGVLLLPVPLYCCGDKMN